MDRSLERIENPNKESGVTNLWTSLQGLPLQMSGYSTQAIRTTTLMLTIALGFFNETEVHRCTIAMVLHAVACVVTTFVIIWNNQETMDSFKKGCELWFNFLFLTETMTLHNSNQKPDSNDEIRENLWRLESKLKRTQARMCACFFTNIPSAFLQNYYIFQSQSSHWLDAVRFVFIATTIFDAAIIVATYERYTHEHKVQLYKLEKAIRPRTEATEPGNFRFCRIFVFELLMIIQWFQTTTYFLSMSCNLASIYLATLFITNYVVLEEIPDVEKPYVNAPHGVHTVASFWTTRIINTVSGVGTELGPGFMSVRAFLFDLILGSDNFNHKSVGFGVMVFFLFFGIFANMIDGYESETDDDELETDNESDTEVESDTDGESETDRESKTDDYDELDLADPYPLITGYAFYNALFEHVREQSRDSLVPLRKLMVASLAAYGDFYQHYRDRLKDRRRELPVWRLEALINDDFEIDTLNEKFADLRNVDVEDSFPFVHEFDEFKRAILEDEDEEKKVKNLKLLYLFYSNFNCIVEQMSSYKILKIFKVMGIEVRKGDEILENKEWVFL